MFRLLNTILFSSFLIITPLLLKGQETWSLQRCVEHALKNNISVKQSEISMEQAKISLLQKKMQMAPTVNGSASNNYNFGRSVDPYTYTFTTEQIQSVNFSLNGNLTLFNGFQLQNELKQSQLDFRASEFDLEKIRNDISLNVTSSFLQVLYAKEQLMAAKNRNEQSIKERDRTKALTEAGSLTQGNLLDAEAQLASDELAFINAENQFTVANLTLFQLLELNESDSIIVEEPVTDVPDLSVFSLESQAVFQLAEQSLPELKSSAYKERSAVRALAIARGARYPRLSFFGSLGTGYSNTTQRFIGSKFVGLFPTGSVTNKGDTVLGQVFSSTREKTPFEDQLNQNYSKSMGFSLNFPLFNGWSVNGNVSRAKLNMKNAQYGTELIRKQVFKSIQQAHADAYGAQKKYYASQKSRDAMRSSFSFTEKKYKGGLLSSLDFLTVKNNLSKAESDFLQAKYDYIFRVKVLDFYAGKKLSL